MAGGGSSTAEAALAVSAGAAACVRQHGERLL
jgi:hypothetical protein